jgi:fructose-specific component phosphotransferase system IIB-like protein
VDERALVSFAGGRGGEHTLAVEAVLSEPAHIGDTTAEAEFTLTIGVVSDPRALVGGAVCVAHAALAMLHPTQEGTLVGVLECGGPHSVPVGMTSLPLTPVAVPVEVAHLSLSTHAPRLEVAHVPVAQVGVHPVPLHGATAPAAFVHSAVRKGEHTLSLSRIDSGLQGDSGGGGERKQRKWEGGEREK